MIKTIFNLGIIALIVSACSTNSEEVKVKPEAKFDMKKYEIKGTKAKLEVLENAFPNRPNSQRPTGPEELQTFVNMKTMLSMYKTYTLTHLSNQGCNSQPVAEDTKCLSSTAKSYPKTPEELFTHASQYKVPYFIPITNPFSGKTWNKDNPGAEGVITTTPNDRFTPGLIYFDIRGYDDKKWASSFTLFGIDREGLMMEKTIHSKYPPESYSSS